MWLWCSTCIALCSEVALCGSHAVCAVQRADGMQCAGHAACACPGVQRTAGLWLQVAVRGLIRSRTAAMTSAVACPPAQPGKAPAPRSPESRAAPGPGRRRRSSGGRAAASSEASSTMDPLCPKPLS
ncbi:unnamed protein product [Caretta caretta]